MIEVKEQPAIISDTYSDSCQATFAEEVRKGLMAAQKHLPSKYFYDAEGDRLFQQIMHLEEYYLTRSELRIIEENKEYLLSLFSNAGNRFRLVELGAGDGLKTKVMLKHFLEKEAEFGYVPIDISEHALEMLLNDLRDEFPALKATSLQQDYFAALESLRELNHIRNVVLFPGSSIGNLNQVETEQFFSSLYQSLSEGDLVMVGFDLQKDPGVILRAYNDTSGITKAFNLNLLERINRELDANFDLNSFRHYPLYDPVSGEARSYLVSTKKQRVRLKALDLEVSFAAWESVHTEISRKYTVEQVEMLAKQAGFRVVKHLFDAQNYFLDSVWERV